MIDAYIAFLSARLHDDEQHADEQHKIGCICVVVGVSRCDCGVPDNIRSWCATGLHILGLHTAYKQQGTPARMAVLALEAVIREMATNYRDHPDHPDREDTPR